jgi:hypothetical protein
MKRLVYQFVVCLLVGLWPVLAMPLYTDDLLTLQVLPWFVFFSLPTTVGFFCVWNVGLAILWLVKRYCG